MIPLRLTLRNFLSYGPQDQTVDFRGIHLACLSGENGHGKSALLDAMTWALWGEARAKVDDLVRLGQTSMKVELEFEVDNAQYRVIRTRTQGKTGTTHTELQSMLPGGESHALTGSGERNTQDRITRLLRMEYDVFVNSAFILQGQADRFTSQKATERKRILSEILGLGQYDELETRARSKQREAEDLVGRLQADVDRLNREIVQRSHYEYSLQEATDSLAKEDEALQLAGERLTVSEQERGRVQAGVGQLDLIRHQERLARQSAEEARERERRGRDSLQKLDGMLARREVILQRLTQFQERQGLLEAGEEAQRRHHDLVEAEREIERRLGEIRQAIDLKRARVEDRLERSREAKREVARLSAELERLARDHRPVVDLEVEFEALREKNENEKCAVQTAGMHLEQLDRDEEQISRRRALLEEPAAACPVCLKPLGADGRENLLNDLNTAEQSLLQNRRQHQSEKRRAEASIKLIREEAQAVKEGLKQSRKTEQDIQCLQQDRARAAESEAAIPALEEELKTILREMAGELDAGLAAQLRQLRAEREALGYNSDRHRALRQEVRQLEGVREEHQKLLHAEESRPEVEQRVEEAAAEALSRDAEADRLAAMARPLECLAARLAELDARCEQYGRERQQALDAVARARESVGSWRSLIESCDRWEEEAEEKRQGIAAASSDAGVYKELALAFGKRGIQAMIIENAVPELEDEANRLLSRMTDNGMHISFQTQRELKKGGGAETLEIVIGDELGDRPYECYSGGEAFRVNFAIRIALSRLLAHRAGARLQTVVIDEGFGTQDTQGRGRLVEAIESIREEFSMILVITHLDDLKDEFPVRLHVVKDQDGSRVISVGR